MRKMQGSVKVIPVKVCRGVMHNICYIVTNTCTRDTVLVDPAWEADKIEQILQSENLILKSVLLTHSHHDHIDLCEYFSRKYDIPTYISIEESKYYKFNSYNLQCFRDNDCLHEGELRILTIPTPGHTKGSTCYYIGNNLFTGDTLFIEGCGLCFGPGADPYCLYDSLNKLKNELPSSIKIYAGHDYGETNGQSMSSVINKNIYMNFSSAEHFVGFRMRKNQLNLLAFR